jgi:CheY-like chemotaxis protein
MPPGLEALIVDDDPAMLRLMTSFLSREGCRVTTTATAEEAIAANPLGLIS